MAARWAGQNAGGGDAGENAPRLTAQEGIDLVEYRREPDEKGRGKSEGHTFADSDGKEGACEGRSGAGDHAAQRLSNKGEGIDVVDISRGEFAKSEHGARRPDLAKIEGEGEENDLEAEGVLKDRDPRGKDTQKRQEKKNRLAEPTSKDMTKDQGWGRGEGGTLQGEAPLAEQSGEIHLSSNPLHGRRKRDEGFIEGFAGKRGRSKGGGREEDDEISGGEGSVTGDVTEQEKDQGEKRRRGALEGKERGRVSIPSWRNVEGDGAAEEDFTEETHSGVAVNLNFPGDPLVEKVLDLNRN